MKVASLSSWNLQAVPIQSCQGLKVIPGGISLRVWPLAVQGPGVTLKLPHPHPRFMSSLKE